MLALEVGPPDDREAAEVGAGATCGDGGVE
jgi:hypothetical protein